MNAWYRRQNGQTTTEWLMVAGVLTMVALYFQVQFAGVIKVIFKALGIALRTPAP